MLRGHYAYYGIAGNIRALQRVHRAVGTLLAQDAQQPELARAGLVEAIPADQGAVPVAATKAVSPLLGAASYRRAVKQLLTSVVREICTLRSVGAGARATVPGHPVQAVMVVPTVTASLVRGNQTTLSWDGDQQTAIDPK